jgi:hypothetical protein
VHVRERGYFYAAAVQRTYERMGSAIFVLEKQEDGHWLVLAHESDSVGFPPSSFFAGMIVLAAIAMLNPFSKAAKKTVALTRHSGDGHILETFTIRAPEDIVAVTHNGSNIIDPRPAGIDLFDDPALQTGLLLVAKIRDASGAIVGFAAESEATAAGSNPLLGKMRLNTDWTIVIPARGTIFATQIEDAGAIGKDILPPVMLGQGWDGDVEFISTVGPSEDGRGIIVGGSREFAGISGAFIELTHLKHMSKARGGVGTFELQLAYKRLAPSEAALAA